MPEQLKVTVKNELLEQKLAVALGAVQERADYATEQLEVAQQRINLEMLTL